jgi:hypothetical protein
MDLYTEDEETTNVEDDPFYSLFNGDKSGNQPLQNWSDQTAYQEFGAVMAATDMDSIPEHNYDTPEAQVRSQHQSTSAFYGYFLITLAGIDFAMHISPMTDTNMNLGVGVKRRDEDTNIRNKNTPLTRRYHGIDNGKHLYEELADIRAD